MKAIFVTKRDGQSQLLNLDKIHQVLEWATEGLSNVSISLIETSSGLQLYDKIETRKIHDILIDSASKLVSESSPDYQYVATRLAIMKLRKEIYGSIEPYPLYDIIKTNTIEKMYSSEILEKYTQQEIEELERSLNHDRDYNIPYVGLSQMIQKYLVKNRVNKKLYETPQIAFMVLSMISFIDYPKETRLKYVKDSYNAISTFLISLPTPIMAGLRTPTKQFSSCVLIDCGDSLDSISSTVDAVLQYASKRAGIGLNVGRLRAINSPIRNGEAYHTGLVPFIKLFESTLNSCSQGGIRKSSATVFFPIWHYEFQDLIVLKNDKGTPETRATGLDYAVQINKFFYERLQKNQDISLFSPNEVPGLYEAFFQDQSEFRKLYEKYEKDKSIRRKTISAEEAFNSITLESLETGRIYIMNVDHSNELSPFLEKKRTIYQSNLCVEITLPTQPLDKKDISIGEISLCTLGGINLGKIKKFQDMEYPLELVVRMLDSIISYQDYSIEAAKKASLIDRSLGIGVINFAYYLAKNKVVYGSQESLDLTHKVFEHFQYYLLKASNKLAKEFGKCPGFNEFSKYSKGILPIDKYKKSVDEITEVPLECDWESLRKDIEKYGLRNNTLSSQFPSECNHWENRILLSTGESINFHELAEKLSIDWEEIESKGIPNHYKNLDDSLKVQTKDGDQKIEHLTYNGFRDLYEVEFEDGSKYKFTENHKLLCYINGETHWIEIQFLKEDYEIVNI